VIEPDRGGLLSAPDSRYNPAMAVRLIALLIVLTLTLVPQSPESVRKEIETGWAKAMEAMHNARSLEDLDEIDRTIDTGDWRGIAPGQPPKSWQELRKYGFEGNHATFQSAEFLIDTFQLNGDTAVVTGRLRTVSVKGNVSFIPLKETWKKTVVGWKRQIHQKFPAGETPR
jgi:hypothetical protein